MCEKYSSRDRLIINIVNGYLTIITRRRRHTSIPHDKGSALTDRLSNLISLHLQQSFSPPFFLWPRKSYTLHTSNALPPVKKKNHIYFILRSEQYYRFVRLLRNKKLLLRPWYLRGRKDNYGNVDLRTVTRRDCLHLTYICCLLFCCFFFYLMV